MDEGRGRGCLKALRHSAALLHSFTVNLHLYDPPAPPPPFTKGTHGCAPPPPRQCLIHKGGLWSLLCNLLMNCGREEGAFLLHSLLYSRPLRLFLAPQLQNGLLVGEEEEGGAVLGRGGGRGG